MLHSLAPELEKSLGKNSEQKDKFIKALNNTKLKIENWLR